MTSLPNNEQAGKMKKAYFFWYNELVAVATKLCNKHVERTGREHIKLSCWYFLQNHDFIISYLYPAVAWCCSASLLLSCCSLKWVLMTFFLCLTEKTLHAAMYLTLTGYPMLSNVRFVI